MTEENAGFEELAAGGRPRPVSPGEVVEMSAACDGERLRSESPLFAMARAHDHISAAAQLGQIEARPGALPGTRAATPPVGLQRLGLAPRCDGLLYVPRGYSARRPAPFVLMLHGAGGTAGQGMQPLMRLADETGIILLAPDARRDTWDSLLGGFGPDVAYINRALARTFTQYAVDPARVGIGGFSDGASYALSLGLTNGILFTHIIAFSPGFVAPAGHEARPAVYVSHGTHDPTLPIDRCSRRIVPNLRAAGYHVTYHEFEGTHTVPPDVAEEALHWFLGD